MKIWLINHYAVPPQYYPLARPSQFAKNLQKMGHEVTIIAASTVHNSNINLIKGQGKIKKLIYDGIEYILVKCSNYQGNGCKRIINILEFATKLPKVLDTLEKPDAIVSTSFDPFSCYEGIKYAKKNGIRAVAEIADLWPETLIAYNGVSPQNPVVWFLRRLEKRIYTEADKIVFTMEGAYDYIIDQGWNSIIPKDKVFYINNGVDLEQYNSDKENKKIQDDDLENKEIFKIVYTGSLRKVNNISLLFDAAKLISEDNIKILVWGDGEERELLSTRKEKECVENIEFKGKVEKDKVPYILAHSDVNFLDPFEERVSRYGISSNKLFEYLAAGKPILMNVNSVYNPGARYKCGIIYDATAEGIAKAIMNAYNLNKDEYDQMCKNTIDAAKYYSFVELTKRLEKIIEEI